MKEVLSPLFKAHFPTLIEGIDWLIIYFKGKADLEKNFTRKMTSWSHFDPHFIILRDNDGSDCTALKSKLIQRANETKRPFHIRIVCQELESWLLGDLQAIENAYPSSKATSFDQTKKYRKPDSLTNASQELTQLTTVPGKTIRAGAIARHLDPSQNRSHSFNLFLKTFSDLSS